jgi:two-component system, response regulator PdtaR
MTPQDDIRVLIVDDDPLVAEMIFGRLDKSRYRVVGRSVNGEQGVEQVLAQKPDVVLMDIDMPIMDGIEATRRIFDQCPTPVVMLTAYERMDLVADAGKAGAGAYLVKPPSLKELERAITIAMARFEDMMVLRKLNQSLQESNRQLQKALDDIKTLSGLLPICASCKKIRDDDGYWNQLEVYIEARSKALFSHGICPECADKLYSGTTWYKRRKANEKG